MLAAADVDGSPTSQLLADAITASALELGVTLANPLAAADSDFTGIVQGQVPQLRDVAELYALQIALLSNTEVDSTVEQNEEKLAADSDVAGNRDQASCRLRQRKVWRRLRRAIDEHGQPEFPTAFLP